MTDHSDHERLSAARGPHAVAWKRLPRAVLLAMLTAVLANTLIYLVAWETGLIPSNVGVRSPFGFGPISLAAVVAGSAFGALGGSVVFALIGRFSRRPVRLFRIIATLALLPTLRTPLTIEGAPLSMVVSLEAMHIITYAVTVWVLTTVARPGTADTEPKYA